VMAWLQPSSQAELLSQATPRRGNLGRHQQHDSVEPWRRRQ
jgi:hypothetical protein